MKLSLHLAWLPLLGLLVTAPGCDPVNRVYKQDTGNVAEVPGPPPSTVAAAPEDEVAFIDNDQDVDAMLAADTDAIEPLPDPDGADAPQPAAVRTYTVQKGDNYWKIAKSVYGDPMRMKDLEAANPGIDPKKLQIGDEILLPD